MVLPPGESPVRQALPYTIVSLLLGWWGIPWGPLHTIEALKTNLNGGIDVTSDVASHVAATIGGVPA
jgi:hypothetical protein